MGLKLHRLSKDRIAIDGDMMPTRNHQLLEEIMIKERDLGLTLRFQRDLEGRYP